MAQAYAVAAPGRGKPKVLVVQPHGAIERDPEHGPLTDAWRCEWAKVIRVEPLSEWEIAEVEAGEWV